MLGSDSIADRLSAPGRWVAVAAVLLALALPLGCEKEVVRDDKHSDNALADQCRKLRPTDQSTELVGASNRSQQIERDLGVQ